MLVDRRIKEIFLDFVDAPHDDPVRSHAGLYSAHTFGEPGKQVKVILLDNRYFYDKTLTSEYPMLGAEQWAWLEAELTNSTAQVHLIGSGLQFVSMGNVITEGWDNFPRERERLFQLISSTRAKGVVFLSGDVHFAELNEARCTTQASGRDGYPLLDVTTSGLTHAWGDDKTLGWIFRTFADNLVPNMQRVGELFPYGNYAIVDVDFTRGTIRAAIKGVDGIESGVSRTLRIADLAPRPLSDYETCAELSVAVEEFRTRSLGVCVGIVFSFAAFVIFLPLALVWRLLAALCCRGKGKAKVASKTKSKTM